jgi:hypothetical protein
MTTIFFLVLFAWILVNIVRTNDPKTITIVGVICLILLVAGMTGMFHFVPEWRCDYERGARHCVFR